jgi:hypothetical protein
MQNFTLTPKMHKSISAAFGAISVLTYAIGGDPGLVGISAWASGGFFALSLDDSPPKRPPSRPDTPTDGPAAG